MTQLDSYFEKAPDKYQVLNQESTKWAGTQYGISINLQTSTWGIPQSMMLYNRQIFEKEGLADPQNLFKIRKWTWEEFLQLAITSTRDLNGDGFTDQYGIGSIGSYLMNTMLYGNTGQAVIQNSDGRFVFNVYDRKCINAFQFIADLFNIYQVATNNVNIIKSKQVAFLPLPSNNYISNKQYTEGLSLIISPSGPDADNKYVTGVSIYDEFFIIPSNVSDKDKIFRLLCEFSLLNNSEANPAMVGSQQDLLVSRYTGWGFQDPRDLDHVRAIFDAYNSGEAIVILDLIQTFGLTSTLSSILTNDIIKLRSSVSSVLESSNPIGQSIIDNLMK
jgi:hypothetical protein